MQEKECRGERTTGWASYSRCFQKRSEGMYWLCFAERHRLFQILGPEKENDSWMSPVWYGIERSLAWANQADHKAGIATQAQTDRLGKGHEQHGSKAWWSWIWIVFDIIEGLVSTEKHWVLCAEHGSAHWSIIKSVIILLLCAAAIALCGDIISENIQPLLQESGMSEVGNISLKTAEIFWSLLLILDCLFLFKNLTTLLQCFQKLF